MNGNATGGYVRDDGEEEEEEPATGSDQPEQAQATPEPQPASDVQEAKEGGMGGEEEEGEATGQVVIGLLGAGYDSDDEEGDSSYETDSEGGSTDSDDSEDEGNEGKE